MLTSRHPLVLHRELEWLQVLGGQDIRPHADWQVFDVRLPLAAHLEKLDTTPILTVYCNFERLVRLRHTDQPYDSVNILEL